MIDRILQAERRIRPYIRETPLEYSDTFSKQLNSRIFLKLENQQITGSFKARGACNKVFSVFETHPKASLITASTGNHGLGMSFALNVVGMQGKIYLPRHTKQSKIDAITARQTEIELFGDTCEETERYVRSLANTNHIYVSPYNDLDVIAGQGTIALELVKQEPQLDYVFVAVGGGGLISGIASYLKVINPKTKIVGCLPQNARTMYECIQAGKIIDILELPTLSDSTAGGVEAGSITFEMCKSFVDDFALVSENEIASAIKQMVLHHHQIIEGAAGVALAAAWNYKEDLRDKHVAVILCGGNTDLQTLKNILDNEDL